MEQIEHVLDDNPLSVLCLHGVRHSIHTVLEVNHTVPSCERDNFALSIATAKKLFPIFMEKKYKSRWGFEVTAKLYNLYRAEYLTQFNLLAPNATDIFPYNNSFTSCFYEDVALKLEDFPLIEDTEVSNMMVTYNTVREVVRSGFS